LEKALRFWLFLSSGKCVIQLPELKLKYDHQHE